MSPQSTRLDKFLSRIGLYLKTSLVGPWSRRSLGLISLLFGFYLGSNITAYFLQEVGQRPLVVGIMVLVIELIIRLRTTIKVEPIPIYWLAIDNLRIGIIYAVVLEAFKLGS